MASLCIEGLVEFRNGTPAFKGTDIDVQPSLATALPEQPDPLSYVFKLQTAKFHNGRTMTSEDVKYSFDTAAASTWKNDMAWYDKAETPDPKTVVIKTKTVYADTLKTIAGRDVVLIVAKEHQESPDAEKKFVGTGPFLLVEHSPPLITRYKRNPDYWKQPYPYFDEIDRLGTSDPVKKVADFSAKQVHMTYWFPTEEREQVKKNRPDAQLWQYVPGGPQLAIRNDVAPFNDKRVRQAISMSYDRQLLINSVAAGEGQADQALSRSGTAWEFRGPEQLPRKDLYVLNVAEAKKLLAAANVTLPLKVQLPTWNSTVIGQKFVDEITSITTQMRNNGIVDAQLLEETFGQMSPRLSGQYDQIHWGPNVQSTLPNVGLALKDRYWSAASGPKAAPTLNPNYVNIAALNTLLEKQLGEYDRKARIALFRQIEEILSEEMVQASGVTGTLTYMIDPLVKNAQMPRDAYNGATPWMKHWFFGKA
jgi:peptide/nickel transport system substrate-binding protein